MACTHNEMIPNNEPGFAWKCAKCGYVYGKNITLNGKPAKIMGHRNRFATVAQLDGPLACEFSWQAVKRILDRGGVFKA